MSSRTQAGDPAGEPRLDDRPPNRDAVGVPRLSSSSSRIRPTIALAPQKLEGKRLLSSSQTATSSIVRRGGPCTRSSEATASNEQITPAIPS